MNILLITAARTWGGVKTWMLALAEFLSERGHNAAIVCREGDRLQIESEKRNLKCYPVRFGMDFSLKAIWNFCRLFNVEATDIIITNISKELRTAGVAAKLRRVKHINRLGAYSDIKKNVKNRLLYNLLVDAVFVPSRSMLDFFLQYDFLKHKLHMFHNAVKVPALHIASHPIIKFAIVAKLSKRKQVDKVIQTFNRIQDLSWELHIGGFGPELETLQILSQELHLQDRIHFTAEKIDPYEFLRDKDVGILYSASEPFGISIIEYMAMSCAVIAANVDGIPEIIEQNVDGILVNPQILSELEEAIRLLIVDSQRREDLIRKGHKKVQTRFNREVIFTRIEQELQEMIKQPQSEPIRITESR